MNSIKKALFITFGTLFVIFGIVAVFIFILINNLGLNGKIIGVTISILSVVFGWWLLRRGSSSVWDALGWLFAQLIP